MNDDGGWLDFLRRHTVDPRISTVFPRTWDRFCEARYFVELFRSIPASGERLGEANWIAGAHISAILGMSDAAQEDFRAAGAERLFSKSEIAKEYFLKTGSDTPAFERDPTGINRAYGDLRNLRTHYAYQFIELRTQVIDEDIARPALTPPQRWFFRAIAIEAIRTLRNPRLSEPELQLFNDLVRWRPAMEIMAQQLYIWFKTIIGLASESPQA